MSTQPPRHALPEQCASHSKGRPVLSSEASKQAVRPNLRCSSIFLAAVASRRCCGDRWRQRQAAEVSFPQTEAMRVIWG